MKQHTAATNSSTILQQHNTTTYDDMNLSYTPLITHHTSVPNHRILESINYAELSVLFESNLSVDNPVSFKFWIFLQSHWGVLSLLKPKLIRTPDLATLGLIKSNLLLKPNRRVRCQKFVVNFQDREKKKLFSQTTKKGCGRMSQCQVRF